MGQARTRAEDASIFFGLLIKSWNTPTAISWYRLLRRNVERHLPCSGRHRNIFSQERDTPSRALKDRNFGLIKVTASPCEAFGYIPLWKEGRERYTLGTSKVKAVSRVRIWSYDENQIGLEQANAM